MNLSKREIQTLLNLLDYAVDNGFFESCDPDEEKDLMEASDDLCSIRAKLYAIPGTTKEVGWDTPHPRSDWYYEVYNGDTQLGYSEWLEHKKEAERED